MKKLLNGILYDTDTALACGTSVWFDHLGNPVEETLYTHQATYFVVLKSVVACCADEPARNATSLTPMTAREAVDWMNVGEVEVLSDHFEISAVATGLAR